VPLGYCVCNLISTRRAGRATRKRMQHTMLQDSAVRSQMLRVATTSMPEPLRAGSIPPRASILSQCERVPRRSH
jgi:hypothetical protein